MANSKDSISSKALKSGIWYTVSNFLLKGVAFFTTPVFARLLSKSEYGEYSNYTAWQSIIAILVTMELAGCVVRARYDFEDDFDKFLSSITWCGSVVTLAFYLIVILFQDLAVMVFGMDMKYIHLMFLTVLISPALSILQAKHRILQKYISFVILSVVSTIVSTCVSLVCVLNMEDKLFARIYGMSVPFLVVYLGAYIILVAKGKTFYNYEYWKYAVCFCLPLVPHLLSNVILGSSDRIMIKNMCGPEEAAVYSLAYSCGMIISVLFTALNQAWEPWLFDRLNDGDNESVVKMSRYYLVFFIILVEGAVLLSPEIMLFMGGKAYEEAIYVIPPVMAGYGCKFAYTFYVNSERFAKKTAYISIGTMVAALLNIVLNLIFIPIFGYMAAAYTTLIGFLVLLFMHYYMSKKMNIVGMYDNKFVFVIIGLMIVTSVACQLLYSNFVIRYMVVGGLIIASLLFCKKLWEVKRK